MYIGYLFSVVLYSFISALTSLEDKRLLTYVFGDSILEVKTRVSSLRVMVGTNSFNLHIIWKKIYWNILFLVEHSAYQWVHRSIECMYVEFISAGNDTNGLDHFMLNNTTCHCKLSSPSNNTPLTILWDFPHYLEWGPVEPIFTHI